MSESVEAASTTGGTTGQANSTGEPVYRERLYAAWWSWPLPLIAAVLMAAQVHMGYPGVRAWLPYVVLVPLAIAVPLWLGRTKIEVTGGELWVGDAHLPLRFIDEVEVITPQEQRRALGPDLDPAAFLVHRASIRTSVRIWLCDENDPTPYWVVSTRHPEELITALGKG